MTGHNTLGRIALGVAVIASVLSCFAASMDVGWVLLAVAFVLGVIAALQPDKPRKVAVAAIIVSVLGAIASALVIIFGVSGFLFRMFADLFGDIFMNSGR
jgi:hypothetical protein